RPRQIFARAKICENALDSSGKTERTGAQKDDRVAANARINLLTSRRRIFDKFPPRRELHNHALQKIGSRAVIQRMKRALLQFFAAASDRASVHIRRGLKQCRVKFHGVVRFGERTTPWNFTRHSFSPWRMWTERV